MSIVNTLMEHGLPLINQRWFCPKCDPESTKSRSVKFYENSYSCFRCGDKGNTQQALSVFLNFTDSESFKVLHPDFKYFRSRADACRIIDAVYRRQNHSAVAWLLERGYPESAVSTWNVGFAPNDRYLQSQGISWEQIELAGLGCKNKPRELYTDRVVFPIYDARGNLTHFQARSTDPESEYKWLASKTKTEDSSVVPLSSVLFNAQHLSNFKEQFRCVFLCEGLTDAHALKALGLPVIATFGIQNLKLLRHSEYLKGLTIFACYDNDRYPVGHTYAGDYKSWHPILPQLAMLEDALEGESKIYTLDVPRRSGIKDIFDFCQALNWSGEDFVDYCSDHCRPLAEKALEVFSEKQTFALVEILKYLTCSQEIKIEMQKRVEANGGWLSVLRNI